MNQILQIQSKNKKNQGPIEIKKIVKFFAIAIIIFGIILIGLGSYVIFTQKNSQINNTVIEEAQPEVYINTDGDNVIINVTHTKPISKIIYNWNEEEENIIETNNNTNFTKTISLPFGMNTLYITVIDINGKETKFQKEYIIDGEGKPIIELKLTANNKIKITVQDSSNLSYMSYCWNNDEAIKVEANADNLGLIEQEVEIPLGQNTLKVQAVNINNITTTKELEVKGVKGPAVSFKKEGDKLIIRAEDEVGMKVVTYTLNGQRYQINYGNKKVIEYAQTLQKGENYLELTAENQDGGITTKKVKCIN